MLSFSFQSLIYWQGRDSIPLYIKSTIICTLINQSKAACLKWFCFSDSQYFVWLAGLCVVKINWRLLSEWNINRSWMNERFFMIMKIKPIQKLWRRTKFYAGYSGSWAVMKPAYPGSGVRIPRQAVNVIMNWNFLFWPVRDMLLLSQCFPAISVCYECLYSTFN